jgi:hypothetical protein
MIRAIMTAAILIASASQLARADDSLLVSPDIIEFYNGTYKSLQPPRAIAVSADGRHMGYSYCPEHRCYIVPSASSLAMQACVKAGGYGCRVFAVDDDIKVKYRVMSLTDLRPPSTTIDTYTAAKNALLTWTEADVRTCFGAPKDNDVVAGWPRYRFKRDDCNAKIMFKDGKVFSVDNYGFGPECWPVIETCKK